MTTWTFPASLCAPFSFFLVATLTTGSAFMFLKPMLSEGQQEAKPDFLEPVSGAAPGAATGSIGSAAAGAAGAIL